MPPEAAGLELPPEWRESAAPSSFCIDLGGVCVTYRVKRRRRRGAITLTIDERGLRVGAPWRASHDAIEQLLHRHAHWVLKKLADWQQRSAPLLHWRDGESLMLLGKPLRLTLLPDHRQIGADEDRLVLGNAAATPPAIAQAVAGWLRQQALPCFRQRIAHFHSQIGVAAPEVRLSNARGRWGSCHSNGRIRLNWRLIQMPMYLIDYVVAHELAHLREMNHSPRFWQTVARMVPDYAARRMEIKTGGYRYLLV
ncbi:MAG: SprT family zinc-dependent metalloprotease [Pseudomonadota bacterium]